MLHSAIYSTLTGFFVFAGREKTKKSCGGEAGRRDDGGELVQAVRMMAAGRRGGRRGGWWWWLVQRQSKYIFTPLSRRWTAAAWTIFAPMQLCTGGGGGSWPEAVTLEGGGREPGGGTRGGSWQAIPPSRLRGLGRYVGLVSRNFFLSFGSPRSAVLAVWCTQLIVYHREKKRRTRSLSCFMGKSS